MSSDIRLGPVSYLVLGVTALRGPSTPYDLKRFVQLSIGHFWPFPHTQLYAEPERLAAAGLLTETREESGRRRRHYEITDAGRAALADWLASPSSPPRYESEALVKVMFAENGSRDDLLASAELGKRVAALLDTEKPVVGVTAGAIGPELRTLGVATHIEGKQFGEDDLRVTAGWGHAGKGGVTMPGKGKVEARKFTEAERDAMAGNWPPADACGSDHVTSQYRRVCTSPFSTVRT